MVPIGLLERRAEFGAELAGCITPFEQLFVAEPTAETLDQYIELALQLFFYWVNFAPLSRGSAACGYILMVSALVAVGLTIAEPIPP